MYVSLTSFINPFSFFCIPENEQVKLKHNDLALEKYAVGKPKMDFTPLEHGQYIAVFYNDNWTRGIIYLENQILIWLVDHGRYIRPNLQTVYKDLPDSYKKLPSKVFEASLHGIIPINKVIKDFFEIETVKSTVWVKGAVEEAKELIAKAEKIQFEPIALISTKQNDVVIGDLYLQLNGSKFVNIINILEKWPMYLERDKEFYIANLQNIYRTRRQHDACLIKPELPGNIPTVFITDFNIHKYKSLCFKETNDTTESNYDSDSEKSTDSLCNEEDVYINLTPSEIVEYSTKTICINGKEFNALELLRNKARDIALCAKYSNLKSFGRATFKGSYYQ